MKIKELRTISTHDNPSEMVSKYLFAYEERQASLADWIAEFDFEDQSEIYEAIKYFIHIVYSDIYMNRKHLDEINPIAELISRRFRKIYLDEEKLHNYCFKASSRIWNEGYSAKLRRERVERMFANQPDAQIFAEAWEEIKAVYNLNDVDMSKIHFFVEQVKDNGKFPNSLRRMLYIWGREKKTGKTTSANYIVATLNGYSDTKNIDLMSSDLAREMQIKEFKLPKIAEYNCVLMDECFYSDMGKTYATFKKMLTSSGGNARMPYGQEFNWVGYPNYVATSNEPLQKFIKDWGDRRYFSIEFKSKPSKEMTIEEVGYLWQKFILNSSRSKGWSEWASELDPIAEEIGEMEEIANEFETELQQSEFLDWLIAKNKPLNRYSADNRITLKVFVDYFSMSIGTQEARKRKAEIEKAVLQVFGSRYSTSNYWMLTDLQVKAQELKDNLTKSEGDDETINHIKLPF